MKKYMLLLAMSMLLSCNDGDLFVASPIEGTAYIEDNMRETSREIAANAEVYLLKSDGSKDYHYFVKADSGGWFSLTHTSNNPKFFRGKVVKDKVEYVSASTSETTFIANKYAIVLNPVYARGLKAKVINKDKEPMNNLRVYVFANKIFAENASNAVKDTVMAAYTGVTNQQGVYFIPNIPNGKYYVLVRDKADPATYKALKDFTVSDKVVSENIQIQ